MYIHINSSPQQSIDWRHSPASVVERRLLPQVPGVDVRAEVQQEFHHNRVPALAGGVQGGALGAVSRVHRGPVLHQEPNHAGVTLKQ